ncbi:MAG TPA: PQQ-binding-like beta-propeller repeat protein [Thermoguttaceae bacterium]|nr:PQQ-binding-like beta-propeller repeat protein [Thermoguttaceae bacterium]
MHRSDRNQRACGVRRLVAAFPAFYAAAVWLLCLGATTARLAADDWPNWRGPNRDAICRETGLLQAWPPEGPKLLWKATGLGVGYSGPAVVGTTLYTLGNLDGQEHVLALDTTTGKRLWAEPFGPVEYVGYSPGTRATPTLDGDRLYALGASGRLVAMDRHSGEIRWRTSFLDDFDAQVIATEYVESLRGRLVESKEADAPGGVKWGFSESVLIDGDKLLCTPGGTEATLAALDKRTGQVVWASKIDARVGYASIVKATLAGVAQYVQFTADGVVGVDARDGKLLWRYDAPAYPKFGGINVSTPIASGDTVFAATGYNVGGGLARIEKTREGFAAREVYFTKDMKNHHGGLILLDGYLYGANDPGILTCLEYATGKVMWRSRKPGKCSLLYADGMLYCRDETGPLTLVKATPDGFELHGQFDQPDRSRQKAWPHLVIAHGQMYVRDQDVLLCYDVRSEG